MAKSLFSHTLAPLVALVLGGCAQSVDALGGEASAARAETPLRVKTHRARGQRWVLGWGGVTVEDAVAPGFPRTVQLVGANLSGSRDSCPPDLLLGRTGVAYVSSNAQPAIWRIDPDSLAAERLDIRLEGEPLQDFGFARLAWGPDEQVLYARSAMHRTVWRVDLAGGTAAPVEGVVTAIEGCR